VRSVGRSVSRSSAGRQANAIPARRATLIRPCSVRIVLPWFPYYCSATVSARRTNEWSLALCPGKYRLVGRFVVPRQPHEQVPGGAGGGNDGGNDGCRAAGDFPGSASFFSALSDFHERSGPGFGRVGWASSATPHSQCVGCGSSASSGSAREVSPSTGEPATGPRAAARPGAFSVVIG